MALSELGRSLFRPSWPICRPCLRALQVQSRRQSSAATTAAGLPSPLDELETNSSLQIDPVAEAKASGYDPLALSRSRKRELPSSRYGLNAMRATSKSPEADYISMQIQVPTAKVLPRPSASSSTSTGIRSVFATVCSRPFHGSSSRADLQQHHRLGPSHVGLFSCTAGPKTRASTKVATMGRRFSVLSEPTAARTARNQRPATST